MMEFDVEIRRGKKLDYWIETFNNLQVEILLDQLYYIKLWKLTYVLENGTKTSYEYKLFHVDE